MSLCICIIRKGKKFSKKKVIPLTLHFPNEVEFKLNLSAVEPSYSKPTQACEILVTCARIDF